MSKTIANFFQSPSFKFMVIGILSLLLLIPAGMIRSLIREREMRNQDASLEISESWSFSQTITGPFLSIPTEELITENELKVLERNTYHLLPDQLNIDGSVDPLEKKRGIFTAVVYNSNITISGHFTLTDDELTSIFNRKIQKEKAFLCIGLNDLRGIGNGSSVLLNGVPYEIMPGLHNRDLTDKGIHVPLDTELLQSNGTLTFHISIELKGSSDLFITPVGKNTEVNIASSWPDPSFTGKFLPSDKKITSTGFDATWEVNYLNRNFPQSWYNSNHSLSESTFGVNFLIPVDHYQKSERSVKYAFMFIALTFLVFLLTEIILKTRIHPIQYLLVGFALIIFYTLLISLAEHVGFNIAYLISTIAVTTLVGGYMKGSTSSGKVGLISGLLLFFLYSFLFTTLQLQELSLLMGSVGLFLILTVIMIVSRKINWYREDSTDSGK